jgi:RNA polymerase sigma-70 factor, ECF subfamily
MGRFGEAVVFIGRKQDDVIAPAAAHSNRYTLADRLIAEMLESAAQLGQSRFHGNLKLYDTVVQDASSCVKRSRTSRSEILFFAGNLLFPRQYKSSDQPQPEAGMMSDDAEVIGRVLTGETSSFRILVERYEKPLFCFLRNLLPNAADCEDAAQEVFLAAYCNLGSYRPETAQFSTWLLTIARNKCLNLLQKRRPVVLDELPERAEVRAPDAALEQDDFFRRLDAALAALPFEQKTAFVLAEIQELSLEEIAQIEGVGVGTVKSRLSRAKEKLRAQLQPKAEPA